MCLIFQIIAVAATGRAVRGVKIVSIIQFSFPQERRVERAHRHLHEAALLRVEVGVAAELHELSRVRVNVRVRVTVRVRLRVRVRVRLRLRVRVSVRVWDRLT